MPKINVYLPDELAEAVRAAKLPVSTICQRALEGALQGAASIREGARKVGLPAGLPPFDRVLTARLQRVLELAHDAAARRAHRFVGTEHLALALLDEGGNLALQVMRSLEVDPDDVRTELEPLLDAHEAGTGEHVPVRTPLADRAIELAGQEAIRMGHNYLGCEHLLLGLLDEDEGLGGRVLRSMGMDVTVTRRATVSALSGFVHARRSTPKASPTPDATALEEFRSRLERIEERLAPP